MHGNKTKSLKQKLVMTAIHLIALLVSAWILFGTGIDFLSNIFGKPKINASSIVRIVIFLSALIYFIKLCFTTFVLIKRQMQWNEVFEVGFFVAIIQILFAILTVYNKESFILVDWILIVLFLFGLYLNAGSEWGRHIWKKKESSKGKLYTEALFKYSMHINYFGDIVTFTAFALLTGSLWGLSIPVFMTLTFVFMHIPKLDKYLKERYKEQFDEYANKTQKLIPWIY